MIEFYGMTRDNATYIHLTHLEWNPDSIIIKNKKEEIRMLPHWGSCSTLSDNVNCVDHRTTALTVRTGVWGGIGWQ